MRRAAARHRCVPVGAPSFSVALVSITPCAGSSTTCANGFIGSSQWRCRPTSNSRASDALDRQPVDEFGVAPARRAGRAALPTRRAGRSASRANGARPRSARGPARRASRADRRRIASSRTPSRISGWRIAASAPAACCASSTNWPVELRRPRSRCRSPLPARRFRRARKSPRAPRRAAPRPGPSGVPSTSRWSQPSDGQRLGRGERRVDRLAARLVVAGDIGQPRREPAPPPARAAFRARRSSAAVRSSRPRSARRRRCCRPPRTRGGLRRTRSASGAARGRGRARR